MNVKCVTRSGRVLASSLKVEAAREGGATVADLLAAYQRCVSKSVCPERQRWYFGDIALADERKTLAFYGIKENDVLIFKDLGPQISWRGVFLAEYGGPLLILPFFYFIYHSGVEKSASQFLVFACMMFHYIKRELETLFVHRFSHSTMPLTNIFKNCGHYWVAGSGLIGFSVFSENSGTVTNNKAYLLLCLSLFSYSQASNFITHWKLRKLRPNGTGVRKIPFGYGFDLVTCPNYFFETLSWFSILLMCWNWSVALFLFMGAAQMYFWAVKKHKNYKKEFPGYPKNRKIMFPFIV